MFAIENASRRYILTKEIYFGESLSVVSYISYGHFKVKLVWAHCKEIVNDTTLCCLFLERTSKIYILNINIFILTKEILWGILHWPHFWHFLWSLQGEIERAPKTLKDLLFWQSIATGNWQHDLDFAKIIHLWNWLGPTLRKWLRMWLCVVYFRISIEMLLDHSFWQSKPFGESFSGMPRRYFLWSLQG